MTNVVELRNYNELALDTIKEFATESGLNSKATADAYMSDAKDFVSRMINDSVYVTTEALSSHLNYKKVLKFRNELLTEGFAGSTVKRKMSSLKELAKYLSRQGYNVNVTMFDTLTKIKSEDNSYEVLDLNEATQLINWIKENEQRKALEKYYYCALAFDTGVRAEALNNLTKSSFSVRETEVIVKGVDKGKKSFTKSISLGFYNELARDLNFDTLDNDTKLFNFNAARRSEFINRAKKGLGWENRNITFHSFKKGAVTYAYSITGDIQVAQKVGSHSSVTTTQRYLKDSEEVFQGAFSDKESMKATSVKFSDFSQEQLIEALSNLPEAVQLSVKKELLKNN